MNKRMCASILSLNRLKPCSRNGAHRHVLTSHASPSSWSLIRPFMLTNIRHRWLLFSVVMKYDLIEPQIKFSLCHSVCIYCRLCNKVHFSSVKTGATVAA